MTPRPVKCWAVVDERNRLCVDTVAETKGDALWRVNCIGAEKAGALWRPGGYLAVRCTLVPEAEARDGE